MIDILVGLLSLILIFFLPGFLVTLIIFPKKGALSEDYDILFKGVLGIVLSLLISILIGMVIYGIDQLSASPEVQSMRLWLILGLLSVGLAFVAWTKGGLKTLLFPKTSAESTADGSEKELKRLTTEKGTLQKTIGRLEGEKYKNNEKLQQEATVRIAALKKDVEKINARIEDLLREEEKKTDGENIA
jgi:NADH:ubiquinone oxidoreductase subunit 5 (subunit L)/multisubunit Na+/H+ antiporter MnhA subunit